MRKIVKRIMVCVLLLCLVWCASLVRDRVTLRQQLIRLHVVAASDAKEDQDLKLLVRDAVVENLQRAMTDLRDMEAAKAYLRQQLPRIQLLAEQVLRELGCEENVHVSLALEEFGTRVYDTFSLPAGLYESLRIVIGDGAGQNWWCVVFPTLCVPATADGFEATAAGAGFSDSLTGTLTGEEPYEVRFYLLDLLGNMENLLHRE